MGQAKAREKPFQLPVSLSSNAKRMAPEALRRAMLDYIANIKDPWNAYPGNWGAFSVVGEGAVQ